MVEATLALKKEIQAGSICAATSVLAWVRSNRWPQRSGLWDALAELCWWFPNDGAGSAVEVRSGQGLKHVRALPRTNQQRLVGHPQFGGSADS